MPGSAPGLLRKDSCQISLPDPTGLLSVKLDSAAIQEANKEVTVVIASTGGKRKPYLTSRELLLLHDCCQRDNMSIALRFCT